MGVSKVLSYRSEHRSEYSKRSISTITKEKDVPFIYSLLCWLVALGYMSPWTFVGSLISYFKTNADANYYVELFAAYYFAGLPVSLMQQKFDSSLDMRFGSARMYLFRGQLAFFIMFVVVLVMPPLLLQRNAMMGLMLLLGASSWMLHGTACMLTSMISTSAISALQARRVARRACLLLFTLPAARVCARAVRDPQR